MADGLSQGRLRCGDPVSLDVRCGSKGAADTLVTSHVRHACSWARGLVLAAALGCEGQISEPEAAPYSATREQASEVGLRRRTIVPFDSDGFERSLAMRPARFECTDRDRRGAGQLGARRLTRDEYLRSAGVVLGEKVLAAAEVQLAAAQIPGETSGDITQEFQNEHAYDHVFGIVTTAQALAKAVVSDAAIRTRVFGACAQSADRKCAATYLAGDVRRILKRPLDETRRVSMLNAFSDAGESNEGLELLLARVLQAPEAVFHLAVAVPQQRVRDGLLAVDAWTVAARVSYALTGRGPDDALLAAAERGELSSLEQVRPHALRLMDSADARTQLEAILDAWLDLQRLPTPNDAVASSRGIDAVALTDEARRELLDYALYEILDRDADAQTLMTADVGFPRSQRMGVLYGSELADGADPVVLPHGHQGLLLRVAPLLSDALRTSPILRGVYVRKRLLCDSLADPDFNAVQKRAEALQGTEPLSARQFTEQLTAPSECMACHAQINPLGFALEGYDGFGASRDLEIIWNADGSELASHALDTRVLDVSIEAGAAKTVDNASQLVQAIASSAKYRACLAERFYTHAQLRPVAAEDTCALSEIEAALREGASVRDAWLLAVLNEDTFVQQAPEEAP